MKHLKNWLVISSLAALSGCAAGLVSTKVTPDSNPDGLRVKLPAPFVVGRPNPAGEIAWKIEYLPDPDEEYAVRAWAFLAKNNSAFTRTRSGMMTSATLDMDTTALATKLAESSGVVGSAAMEALNTKQEAAREAAAAQKTDVAAKEASLTQKSRAFEYAREDHQRAETELLAAEAELRAASPNDTAAIAAANTRVKAAQDAKLKTGRALSDAEFAVTDAKSALKSAKDARFDTGGGPATVKLANAPGPVIYRIVEDPVTGGITLRQVNFEVFELDGKQVAQPFSQLGAETWGTKPAKKE